MLALKADYHIIVSSVETKRGQPGGVNRGQPAHHPAAPPAGARAHWADDAHRHQDEILNTRPSQMAATAVPPRAASAAPLPGCRARASSRRRRCLPAARGVSQVAAAAAAADGTSTSSSTSENSAATAAAAAAASAAALSRLSITTFNVLAPCYKRFTQPDGSVTMESASLDIAVERQARIVRMLSELDSSVLCLQEFWHASPEVSRLYERGLGEAGFELYVTPRTGDRPDGLLTAVRRKDFEVVERRDILFNDCGERVATLLHLRHKVGRCRLTVSMKYQLSIKTRVESAFDSTAVFSA